MNKVFHLLLRYGYNDQDTGLGLSYDIIKAHGGEITVESKEVEGTTFINQLPFST